jgi:hypothetical protein
MKLFRTLSGAALVGAAMMSMTGAKADLVVNFVGTQAGTVAGTTDFVYQLNLPINNRLTTNDFATFYDVFGVSGTGGMVLSSATVGGTTYTAQSTAFTPSEQLVGLTPPFTAQPDSPTLENVTFTYTGGTTLGPTDQVSTSSLGLVALVSSSSTVNVGTTPYAAQAERVDPQTGQIIAANNVTFVTGPNPAAPPPPGVPEPGSVALMVGSAVSGSFFLLRKRRSK